MIELHSLICQLLLRVVGASALHSPLEKDTSETAMIGQGCLRKDDFMPSSPTISKVLGVGL